MRSIYSVTRAIAAVVLLFLVLGLLFTNAKSMSHELIEQLPHADSSHHAQSGDHDPEGSAVSEGAGHSHEHDPTDHTHDIPLRFLLAAALPAFLPNWEAGATAVLYSISSFPLERPPKLLILA